MINLHLGACLDVLPALAEGSVDLVCADLPYGVTCNLWDTVIPLAPLWAELLRVGKRNCAFVFTATQPFATALVCSQPNLFRYDLVWDKLTMPTGFLNARLMPLRIHELLMLFYRSLPTYNPQLTPGKPYIVSPSKPENRGSNYGTFVKGHKENVSGDRLPRSIVPIRRGHERNMHPTQKPIALLEWIIRTYSNPGDTILDPTMGSGTTGVACVNTARNFVGVERDAGYFSGCQDRIAAAAKPYARKEKKSAGLSLP